MKTILLPLLFSCCLAAIGPLCTPSFTQIKESSWKNENEVYSQWKGSITASSGGISSLSYIISDGSFSQFWEIILDSDTCQNGVCGGGSNQYTLPTWRQQNGGIPQGQSHTFGYITRQNTSVTFTLSSLVCQDTTPSPTTSTTPSPVPSTQAPSTQAPSATVAPKTFPLTILCSDQDAETNCTEIQSTQGIQACYAIPASIDNTVSSFQVFADFNANSRAIGLILYTDADCSGSSETIAQYYAPMLPASIDNLASSFRFLLNDTIPTTPPVATVAPKTYPLTILCSDVNAEGSCTEVQSKEGDRACYSIPPNLFEVVSSFQVFANFEVSPRAIGLILYSNADCTGYSESIAQYYAPTLPASIDNGASSFRFLLNETVEKAVTTEAPVVTVAPKAYPLTILCSDEKGEGRCKEVESTEGDRACYNIPGRLDNMISSFQVFANFQTTPRAIGLILYADGGCRGYSESIAEYYAPTLSEKIDNIASSFRFLLNETTEPIPAPVTRVFPNTVLCADADAETNCTTLESFGGVRACYNIPDRLDNAVSSFQVFADFNANPRAIGLILYADSNCNGYSESIAQYYAPNLPTTIDNSASSFRFLLNETTEEAATRSTALTSSAPVSMSYPLTILCADERAETNCTEVQSTEGDRACYSIPAILDNTVSSFQVFANFEVSPRAIGLILYSNDDCTGYSESIAQYYAPNLPASIDNSASSFRFLLNETSSS